MDGAATNVTEEDGYVISKPSPTTMARASRAAEDLYERSGGETVNVLVMERPDSESGQDRPRRLLDTIAKYDNLILLEHNSTVTDNAEQELGTGGSWVQKI